MPHVEFDAAPSVAVEWDTLTAALNRWGVLHVAPGTSHAFELPGTAAELFERLWRSGEPRLNQAAVLLLLTHPHLATDARSAIAHLEGDERDRGMRRYVAAAALQRMARSRIMLSLGSQPVIPPAYLDVLEVPSLDVEFGRETLLAVAEQERERYGYDAWGTYRTLLDLFLGEIRRRGWGMVCANEPIAPD